MKAKLTARLNDSHLDVNQSSTQRQIEMSISALSDGNNERLPLNLCLVLDHSGSMQGKAIATVKEAAIALIEKLTPTDTISVIGFDHCATVIVSNRQAHDIQQIKQQIQALRADGGTAIDEGLKLGMEEIAKNKNNCVSQILLLTDGENEHGDNNRCLKFAKLAAEFKITLNALGFGNYWNQDILEQIADSANGSLSHIEKPENAVEEFNRLFKRIESVGLTNAYLLLELAENVRLAELKPIAQVAPETIDLPVSQEDNKFVVRLGDLMKEERLVLANIYLGPFSPGIHNIAKVQVKYDDPILNQTNLYSDTVPIDAELQLVYQPQPIPEVQKSILTLAKYRQTQIAETKLQKGDTKGAATMLQVAAQTALQLGEKGAATVLQTSATRLESGEQLSDSEKKKTRMVAKTKLQL